MIDNYIPLGKKFKWKQNDKIKNENFNFEKAIRCKQRMAQPSPTLNSSFISFSNNNNNNTTLINYPATNSEFVLPQFTFEDNNRSLINNSPFHRKKYNKQNHSMYTTPLKPSPHIQLQNLTNSKYNIKPNSYNCDISFQEYGKQRNHPNRLRDYRTATHSPDILLTQKNSGVNLTEFRIPKVENLNLSSLHTSASPEKVKTTEQIKQRLLEKEIDNPKDRSRKPNPRISAKSRDATSLTLCTPKHDMITNILLSPHTGKSPSTTEFERHKDHIVYVIPDNVDIGADKFAIEKINLGFYFKKFKVDALQREAKLLNQMKPAGNLESFQIKLEKMNTGTKLIQKQILKKLIDDINAKFKRTENSIDDYKYIFILNGSRITQINDIPSNAKVLLVSHMKSFFGISGWDEICDKKTFKARSKMKVKEIMAEVGNDWVKRNLGDGTQIDKNVLGYKSTKLYKTRINDETKEWLSRLKEFTITFEEFEEYIYQRIHEKELQQETRSPPKNKKLSPVINQLIFPNHELLDVSKITKSQRNKTLAPLTKKSEIISDNLKIMASPEKPDIKDLSTILKKESNNKFIQRFCKNKQLSPKERLPNLKEIPNRLKKKGSASLILEEGSTHPTLQRKYTPKFHQHSQQILESPNLSNLNINPNDLYLLVHHPEQYQSNLLKRKLSAQQNRISTSNLVTLSPDQPCNKIKSSNKGRAKIMEKKSIIPTEVSSTKNSPNVTQNDVGKSNIQKLCEEFKISRRYVYEIAASYNSLLSMETQLSPTSITKNILHRVTQATSIKKENKKQNHRKRQDKKMNFESVAEAYQSESDQDDTMVKETEISDVSPANKLEIKKIREAIRAKQNEKLNIQLPNLEDKEKDQSPMALIDREGGVKTKVVMRLCPLLAGHNKNTIKRILRGLGIDYKVKNSRIFWEQYIRLYCLLDRSSLSLPEMSKFWSKFFDAHHLLVISEDTYMNIIEELVRGNSLSQKTSATVHFGECMKKVFQKNHCLNEYGDLIIPNLENAILDNNEVFLFLNHTLNKHSQNEKPLLLIITQMTEDRETKNEKDKILENEMKKFLTKSFGESSISQISEN